MSDGDGSVEVVHDVPDTLMSLVEILYSEFDITGLEVKRNRFIPEEAGLIELIKPDGFISVGIPKVVELFYEVEGYECERHEGSIVVVKGTKKYLISLEDRESVYSIYISFPADIKGKLYVDE